jgi:hypothetical protein
MLKVVHDASASNEVAGGSLLDEIVRFVRSDLGLKTPFSPLVGARVPIDYMRTEPPTWVMGSHLGRAVA